MRFKHVISTLALAMVTAFGVAAGLQPKEYKVASADPEPEYFYMVGNMNGWNNSDKTYPILANGHTESVTFDYTFKKDDAFKVVKTSGSWDNELNYNNIIGTGALKASPCFVKGEGNTNIVCDVAGDYSIRILYNGASYYLIIDKADQLTAFGTAKVYIQLNNWDNTLVYAYDETTYVNKMDYFGAYGGIPASTMMGATTGVNFKGELGGIALFPVPYVNGYKSNSKFIINNNGASGEGNQSGNLSVVDGAYYRNTGTVGDLTHGAAAKVVFDIAKKIEYAGGESLCNLTKSEAQTLVDEYNACEAQNIVNLTTFWT